MESSQTGLLERLRQQRESMQAASAPMPAGPIADDVPSVSMGAPQDDEPPARSGGIATVERGGILDDHAARLTKVEADGEDVRRRLDSIESNLRQGLADLRAEVPGLVTGEVNRLVTPTNEAVAELGGRVSRFETEFTRERERWATVVTSFDQRLDQRLRSFRQDVTVMLTGMAVLILAMLMLLLLRR